MGMLTYKNGDFIPFFELPFLVICTSILSSSIFIYFDITSAISALMRSVEEITKMSIRLPLLNDELDEKSMRWLELSELA